MSTKYKFHNVLGVYFITFAVVDWIDVFTRKEYRDVLIENLAYCQKEKGLILYAWCIMSNHIHIIAQAKEGHQLSDILRDYKKYTSKKLVEMISAHPQESRKEWMIALFEKNGKMNSNNKKVQFWRQDNHPIELYSNAIIEQKLNYIHNNPVVAGLVAVAEHYLYSSAIDYSKGNNIGFLNIEWL